MSEASSPRSTWPRVRRTVGLVTGAVLFAVMLVVPAQATDLATLRKQAAAAAAKASAAQAQASAAAKRLADAKAAVAASGQAVTSANGQVRGTKQGVETAGVVLTESERQLGEAQQRLFDVQTQLQEARDYDAQLAAELADAQEALISARGAVEAGQAELVAMRGLMGASAREAFQQQTPLEGLATLAGAQSPTDLARRVQWTETVFDTEAANQVQLSVVQLQLQASRDLRDQIEQRISAAKQAAAAQVAVIAELESQAAQEKAVVQVLVDANEASLRAAQKKLAAAQGQLGTAQAGQAAATKAFSTAQGELAATQASYQAALAEEQATEDEIRRLIASQGGGASDTGGSGSVTHGVVSASGFVRPIDAEPGSRFGMRFHPILHIWRLHAGVDFGAPCGTPIYAARGGTVLQARMTSQSGLYTVLGHGTIGGTYVTTSYSHQSRSIVHVGQKVSRGQVIGYVGNTGLSTECHLHFEIRHNGVAVNPLKYIP